MVVRHCLAEGSDRPVVSFHIVQRLRCVGAVGNVLRVQQLVDPLLGRFVKFEGLENLAALIK